MCMLLNSWMKNVYAIELMDEECVCCIKKAVLKNDMSQKAMG